MAVPCSSTRSGSCPPLLQVKLLRALAERTVLRMGELRPEPVDIRVITATHRNLEAEVKAGRFREDLYWRIHVVSLHLPPLRERGEDILLLATELLRQLTAQGSSPVQGFSPRALQAMKRYDWPGNVRQLENHLHAALAVTDKTILGPEDIGLDDKEGVVTLTLDSARERFARQYVMEVVERYGGNRRAAASALGVDPRTVFRYLERRRQHDKPKRQG